MNSKLLKLILQVSIASILLTTSCKKDEISTKDNLNGGINPNIETGSFIDARDGKSYKTVKIGQQTWMAENLAFLPDSGYQAYSADSLTSKYGYLYDWETAKLVAPVGWHLPSKAEWEQLENYLIENGYSYDGIVGNKYVAKSLASKNGWKEFSEYDLLGGRVGGKDLPDIQNQTGFTALPGGCYTLDYGHAYLDIQEAEHWWTSSDTTINQSHLYQTVSLSYDVNSIYHGSFTNNYYLNIRCAKD